jgi:hypothetical protein
MNTDIGEYAVGAYLRIIMGCEFVDYNIRNIKGGLKGLNELDVIGLNLDDMTAYLCEVTTHIKGLLYGGSKETTVNRVKQKYQRQKDYAKEFLKGFKEIHYMFWSPVVPQGYRTDELKKIRGLDLVINERYTVSINELKEKARAMSNDVNNPFFRVLQILEHLK